MSLRTLDAEKDLKKITKELKMATQGSDRKLQAEISNCSRDAEMIPHCLHRCRYHTSMRLC